MQGEEAGVSGTADVERDRALASPGDCSAPSATAQAERAAQGKVAPPSLVMRPALHKAVRPPPLPRPGLVAMEGGAQGLGIATIHPIPLGSQRQPPHKCSVCLAHVIVRGSGPWCKVYQSCCAFAAGRG